VNPFLLLGAVLVVAAAGPGLLISSRGSAVARLAGLQLVTALVVLLFVVVSTGTGQTSMLIVPLVTVLLSFAGTLVFARLLRGRS
jgi:multisubunit Na+/H+ antiporter MnhF subunit